MRTLLKDLHATPVITIKSVCCNNEEDNNSFMSLCKQEGMGVKFKYVTSKWPCWMEICDTIQRHVDDT